VLKNGAIYFIGRFGAALVTLLSVSVYTRLLSPDEYGVYALVSSGALMAYAGMLQWLTLALARFLPAYHGREDIPLTHIATAYAATALLVLAGPGLLVPLLIPAPDTRTMLVLGVGILLVMSLAELALVTFQMRGKAYRYVQLACLRVAVAAALGVVLAYVGWGSVGLLCGVFTGHLCIALASFAEIRGSIHRSLLSKELFRELAAYGFPFAMTGALAAVINASDRYIIGILIGADAAGLYAAPYDLAMRSLHVLMMVVAMAGSPIIVRAYEAGGETATRRLIQRQAELLLGLALPVAIAYALLAPAITEVFFGEAFQATARELMPWVAAATVLKGFQAFCLALAFSLPKRPLRQTCVFVFGAVVNAVLNFLLIPRMGLMGAAVATVVSYMLILIGSFLSGRKLFSLPLPKVGLAKILTACAVWALILSPVHNTTALAPVLLQCLIGAVVYFTIFCSLDVGGTRHLLAGPAQLAFSILHPGLLGLKRWSCTASARLDRTDRRPRLCTALALKKGGTPHPVRAPSGQYGESPRAPRATQLIDPARSPRNHPFE
jgi:O-antigen/teichoic acid export membrane protein